MSTWRRRSMPGIWLALLSYLVLSGLDVVHMHGDHVADLQHLNIPTITAPAHECPLCAWHALANPLPWSGIVVPACPDVTMMSSLASMPFPQREIFLFRTRGPPSRVFASIAFLCTIASLHAEKA